MDNFRIIYKILKALEKAMDCEEVDVSAISHKSLGISKKRWELILEMLYKEGLIEGIAIIETIGGHGIKIMDPRITMGGLQFLDENSLMRKASNLAKGIVEVIT